MNGSEITDALTGIIKVLDPLSSEERHRVVNAAMIFLGESRNTARNEGAATVATAEVAGEGNYTTATESWMRTYNVTSEELDQVFHFRDDGTFDIHDSPGKTKKDKTINTYILTGLGKFLSANDRNFDDAMARKFCETMGCYDPANHASSLKNKGAEFSGDKHKGYSLSNVGVKRGAALVKEVAAANK